MYSKSVDRHFEFDVDWGEDVYHVEGSFYGTITFSPGTMYRRNGDPGDPPEYDSELEDIVIDTCTLNDSEENLEVKKDSDLYTSIEARCLELLDEEDI